MDAARSERRGRPPKVTEASIAEAVLAEGFAGLTVPAVAARLGVSTVTLYRHVPTRAQLLALGWDHVLDDYSWPLLDLPWRELLEAHAVALWDLLAEHPGIVTEMSTAMLPQRMVGLFENLAAALVGQGFTAGQAVRAADAVLDLTLDHRRGAETLTRPVEGTTQSLREQIGTLWTPGHTDDAPTPSAQAAARQAVRQAMSEAIAEDPRVWFRHKLDLILDGIAANHGPTNDSTDATDIRKDEPT